MIEPDWVTEFGASATTAADASDVWARMTTDIALTDSQRDAGAAYCLAVARVAEAERLISRDGLVIVGVNGQLVKHPATALVTAYSASVRALQNALGLNPYAAARNRTMAKAGTDPYDVPETAADRRRESAQLDALSKFEDML
ncbi:P27 family phage terminase small subunit [Streptomyces sp. NE06-03E]|uniref:P27 family phage terminase small subunit n=1 Tax=unclassified Streptomyces TaxID=2593676 RepID=UPI000F5528CE|nr:MULTISPECIES: P27 family phage terminase small subunit [unclassified Streptomyces]MDX3056670.1 P27 family phage terminase small subunit [Streptomyces sp. NE06-03E]RPK50402.1 Phage terminase, small subunit [Streptomyces sp. ADI93-02]